jgi:hypothetical protein
MGVVVVVEDWVVLSLKYTKLSHSLYTRVGVSGVVGVDVGVDAGCLMATILTPSRAIAVTASSCCSF